MQAPSGGLHLYALGPTANGQRPTGHDNCRAATYGCSIRRLGLLLATPLLAASIVLINEIYIGEDNAGVQPNG